MPPPELPPGAISRCRLQQTRLRIGPAALPHAASRAPLIEVAVSEAYGKLTLKLFSEQYTMDTL